jgi:hypothetical protein
MTENVGIEVAGKKLTRKRAMSMGVLGLVIYETSGYELGGQVYGAWLATG